MQFFRILYRQTKSESDVSTLLFQPGPSAVVAPVFVPLHASLPSFDPARELYASPTDPSKDSALHIDELNARIVDLESQLTHLQDERSALEQDLADYRTDLLHARMELYTEMLACSRQQQRGMDDFRTIQKLEARHERFCTLLVDIGLPRPAVDVICQAIQDGSSSPDHILVDAIKDALHDSSTLLARLKPIITDERTPEHYQSALNLTLSIRKELKSQQKRSKFWKKLAHEDDRHANIITPSPSDISSIRQDLSSERQDALDALIARRRLARNPDTAEVDVFGGQLRESTLDTLATSLASRPRRSIPDDLRLSSSFSSSSASSTSVTYFSQFSSLSRAPQDSTTETPTIPSRLPSSLSTSLRRSSRDSQSIVLGSINLNISRSSSIDPALPEETEELTNLETGPTSTLTYSQSLLQNSWRASQRHRRMPSTSSRRSVPSRSGRSSFRLSTFSPIRGHRSSPAKGCDSDISVNATVDAPSFQTTDMMRLSDLAMNNESNSDTPASSEVTRSEHTPFNDALVLPKFGVDTPLSPTDLESRVSSTPLDESNPLRVNMGLHDAQFLEHLDCNMLMSISVPESESNARARDRHDHARTDSGTGTIPIGESKDSLFTTSTSSLSANDTPAPTTPPTPSPSPALGLDATSPIGTGKGACKASIGRSMLPVLAKHLRRLSLSGTSPDRERLVDKLRGLRSLSRSKSRSSSGPGSPPFNTWRGSPARSASSSGDNLTPSPSPVKGSAIPVLQRRMTIRARRTSVRNV